MSGYTFRSTLLTMCGLTALYKAGYLDGLQAAIVAASENSSDNSYTIDLEDIF